MCPMEKASLILVCEHCAGQFRAENFAIADTKGYVRCPNCSAVIVVNGDGKPGSEPRNDPGSKETTTASGDAPALREDDREVAAGTGRSAKGPSDRLEAARNAVDDLLTPVPKPSGRKSPPPPTPKRSRRKSSPPPKAKPARRQYPPLPPPSRRSPQQPVRAAPQPQGPRADPSAEASPIASPPTYAEPAETPAEASPVASKAPAERAAALLVVARQWLQSGLEALVPWITAAAEMPVAAKAGAAVLLLGLLMAVAFWLDWTPQRAAGITRRAAAATGLDPEASPRVWGQAGASQRQPTRRPGPMGRWAGAVGSLEETKRAPKTPKAIVRRAAPATRVTAAAPPPTAKTAAELAPAPAKAVPTASPPTKTVEAPAAAPRAAPKASAKAAATSEPGTTPAAAPRAAPKATAKATATSKPGTTAAKPSAVSTTRSPTRRPRTVRRPPVSEKTISSGSEKAQQQGESGWVIEY